MPASISRRSRLSAIELARDRQRAAGVVGDQAFDAERHVGQPAGGVEARPEHEAQVVGGRARGIAAGRLEQRGDARLHAARAYALQSLLHQDAVVVVEPHDVGDGAERDEVEQLARFGSLRAEASVEARASAP